jgi:two-component system, OmpR family, response regulator
MSLSSRPSQGSKILLVDGDPNYVFLLKKHLQAQHYEVATAENTLEAIAQIEACTPDLVITGAVLAEGRGHDLLAYLRQQPGDLSWIPLIFVSAKARRSDRIEGINAGATAYVTKPLSLEELNAQVESCLRNSQNIRQGQQKPSPPRNLPADVHQQTHRRKPYQPYATQNRVDKPHRTLPLDSRKRFSLSSGWVQ